MPPPGHRAVRSAPGGRLRTALLVLVWLMAFGYSAALALHPLPWFGLRVDGWLLLLTVWVPSTTCWVATARSRARRPEMVLAAAAVTAFAVGDTLFVLEAMAPGSLPLPALADVSYLLAYPPALVALVIIARRHTGGLARVAWLDCASGALGAGALLVLFLSPVLGPATAGLPPLAALVAVVAPAFDLLVVAVIAGLSALHGVHLGGRWVLLASGLLAFAASDVAYVLHLAAGSYVLGGWVDAGWAFGLALIATWVDSASSPRRPAARAADGLRGAGPLVVASAATLTGLTVLVLSSWMPVPVPALGLAAAALLATGVRAQLAARVLERMADQRLVAAVTDDLTGLPNRRALQAEAGHRLADPDPRPQALLLLDLDRFKDINDGLGNRAGDQLLVAVGARLRKTLHDDDLLVRLGGDEFALLLDDAGEEEAVDVATRLAVTVAEPLSVEHTMQRPRVSIGIALFPRDGADLGTLMRRADTALYRAKTARKAYHVYRSADDLAGGDGPRAVQELRTALELDQFVLHYQPKVDLASGEVHDVEALVRWNHPTRGLLAPDGFLSLIEDAGLMPALTRTVIARALDQVAAWRRAGHELTVAVNLSSGSLADRDLPGQVAELLAGRGLPPSALQVEITEEFLMRDRDLARAILAALRSGGVRVSVDDFGTGYNSLACLRDLPIDELKLDSSFVTPMGHDARAAAVVASTIDLAHTLGLRIVAEGVETGDTYTELTLMGCDQAQGYFVSRPIPAAEFDRWLETWCGGDPWAGRQAELSPALTPA